jgi:hypothetical protein
MGDAVTPPLWRILASHRSNSCEWCGVAVFIALAAFGLGFVHLWGHP